MEEEEINEFFILKNKLKRERTLTRNVSNGAKKKNKQGKGRKVHKDSEGETVF